MGTYERITTVQSSATTDDGSYYNGSYYGAQTWYWVGRRTGSTGCWVTYLFPVPADVDPDSITSVKLKLWANGTGSPEATIRVRQGAGVAPASSGDDRPDTIYNTVGSTGEVDWTFTIASSGDMAESPNISSRVASALNSINQSTEKLSIHLGPDTAASGTAYAQMFSRDYNTDAAKRPTLVIVETLPDNPTPSVSAVVATSTVPGPLLYERKDDVSYDSTPSGYSYRRVVDIYLPMGTPPADGWPVAFFVHGGGFMDGDENDVMGAGGYRYRHDTMAYNGFAIVSVSYKLTEVTLDVVTGWTRPHPQQDIFAALKWLGTQTTYDLDSTKIVATAYSAGGHLMLEAACFLEDPNIDTYEASSSGMSQGATPGTTGPYGDRYTDYPTLDITQGRTNIPRPIGVFTFGGAVSLSKIWDDSLIFDWIINAYFGARPSTGYVKAAVNEEGDIDAFITGLAGSIYEARDATPPKFPIGLMYTTNDTTVPVSAGYTPLRAALNTAGYKVDTDTDKQVNTGVALSRYSYTGTGDSAGGHDTLMNQYDRTFFRAWLKNTLALTLPTTVAATSTVPTPTWSEETPATGGTAEPTAVAATSTVPAAAWGVTVPGTVVTATSTVPATAWGAGWVPGAVAGTTTITAPAAAGGGAVSPSTVTATSTTPAPTWGAGWALASVTGIAAIAAQAGVGGGFTTPAVVNASATTPAPVWGAGWVLASATASTTVPGADVASGGTALPAAVAAASTVPTPTLGQTIYPVAVASTSTVPVPVHGAGWTVTAVTATTTIAAQAGVGGGYTTPQVVAATTSVPAPTWGAGWVLSTVTSTTAITEPTSDAGGRTDPTTVTATGTIPTPVWGAGHVLTTTAAAASIPGPSVASGGVVTATAVTAAAAIPEPSAMGQGLVPITAVAASSAVPSPTLNVGWTLTPVTSEATVPAVGWGSGLNPTTTAAATTIPQPTMIYGMTMVMQVVAAVILIGQPYSTSRLRLEIGGARDGDGLRRNIRPGTD